VSRLMLFGVCCVALLIAKWEFGATARIGPSTQTLTVREEPSRVVLAWSGPISDPMRDHIVTAIDKYKADQRHLVIALNSPGGSIAHGREVMEAIRKALRVHPIDTLVEKAGVCASMCLSTSSAQPALPIPGLTSCFMKPAWYSPRARKSARSTGRRSHPFARRSRVSRPTISFSATSARSASMRGGSQA